MTDPNHWPRERILAAVARGGSLSVGTRWRRQRPLLDHCDRLVREGLLFHTNPHERRIGADRRYAITPAGRAALNQGGGE